PELGSRLWVDVSACEASPACAPALAQAESYYRERRPDIAALLADPRLDPFEAETIYVALVTFGWDWVMVTTHDDDVRPGLDAMAPLGARGDGWREVPGWREPPLARADHPHRVVSVAPGALPWLRPDATLEAFWRPGEDLAALRAEPSRRRYARSSLMPERFEARLRVAPTQGEAPPAMALSFRGAYPDAEQAERAKAMAERRIEAAARMPVLALAGLASALESITLRREESTLLGELTLTGAQAALLTRLLLNRIRLPDGM
ncbi:MAG TPA: hypothetical protein RMH80_34540, partial [Polyangiaceae bacterium LLY-WYZ-15_(1-7)]|nr:hypothetical protein [Polyangiaceae bacterium LLY-WYZ-15_(1-7)]